MEEKQKTDDSYDRRIIRHVKCHWKQTLQEITDTVNNFIPQSLAPPTVRRRLRSVVLQGGKFESRL